MNFEEAKKYSDTKTKDLLAFYIGRIKSKYRNVRFEQGCEFADFDYKIFIDNKLSHFIEAKIRHNKLKEYKYTKLPLRKHTFAEHAFKRYKIKTYFLARFTDNIGLLDLTQEPDDEKVMVARHDRGIERDLYALYDINKFKILL